MATDKPYITIRKDHISIQAETMVAIRNEFQKNGVTYHDFELRLYHDSDDIQFYIDDENYVNIADWKPKHTV